MAGGFESTVIGDFTGVITAKLDEAAGIARAANGLSTQGLPDRAFRTLLDIEPLIADAATLLNAASVLRRHAADDG